MGQEEGLKAKTFGHELSGAAIAAGPGHPIGLRRPVALICAFGLAIGLMGCHPQANKTPPLPLPSRPAATLPRPVRPTFYVTINELNVRACPGLDCPKTSTLELNAEVEKLGQIGDWTQIKVKKDGTIGYVSSRYLSPKKLVEVAKLTKKKPKKAKHRKTTQPPVAAEKEEEAEPKQQEEPSPPLPRVM
ncbi:MAG: SH3 domain-containing protein [Desulfobaccales bacterium]